MEPSELLQFVVGVLERCGLRYFVTGSTATIFFGEPRFTNDIDIVVALQPAKAQEFCQAFPESDFYVSEDAARQAAAQCGQFNIIHPASGLKIDLIVPPSTPFNDSRFERAVRVSAAEGIEASFASAEDVIIKKLEYYREGGSEKHLRDIAGVLKVSGDQLDVDYIARWVSRLGLESVWAKMRQNG